MASKARKERRRLERERRNALSDKLRAFFGLSAEHAMLDPEFDEDDVLPQPSGAPRQYEKTHERIPGQHAESALRSLVHAPDRSPRPPKPTPEEVYVKLSRDSKIDEAVSAQMNLPSPVAVKVRMPDDIPLLIERQANEQAQRGQSYEEANWAKLSPAFRQAHNKLRVLRGMDPIPPPAIDLYRPPPIRRADPKELEALEREASAAKMEFLSGGPKGAGARLMAPGREGFTIDGDPVKF